MLDETNKIGRYLAIRIGIFIFAVSATAQTTPATENHRSRLFKNCIKSLCLNLD